MQPAISAPARRILTIVRRPARRANAAHRHSIATRDSEARANAVSGEQDFRAQLAAAFVALGSGVVATKAQAQSNAFYRSGRHDWAHALDGAPVHDFRNEIATAFRALGTGSAEPASQERTVAFYRGSGQAWAASLG